MVDALIGSVIMVVATTSLFLAVEVVEGAFHVSGRHPVNPDEQIVLDRLRERGSGSPSVLRLIDVVEDQIVNQLPSQYKIEDVD